MESLPLIRNKTRSAFCLGIFALLCAAQQSPLSTAQSLQATVAYVTAPANPRAVVLEGNARFTILTPQMIRMEWSPDRQFVDAPSLVFVHRDLPVPTFSVKRSGQGKAKLLQIDTGYLKLEYKPKALLSEKFQADNLSVTLQMNGQPVVWHPGMKDEKNLQGTTRTLDGATGGKTLEPMDPGLISRDGWVVVDDSQRPLFDSSDFSFSQGEKSPWPWVAERPEQSAQDLYFFGYGHNYRQALGDFVKVAGRIPLPPRYAFGTWWSRYWSYSDQELLQMAEDFRQNDLPLDVLVIDMGWHPTFSWLHGVKDQAGERKGWTGYSWDKLLFPAPDEFLKQVHADGLRTTLNLHPAGGVQPWEDAYPAMARAMGIDPATQKYVPFDITDKKFATAYMQLLHHPLEQQGIDFWWLDWQSKPQTKLPNVTATWWLNYVHFTDQEREGKRPLLFHRWGGLGNHRYQIGFSGDTISVWDSLAFQPWFTATAANVGYAYWSHDIGGHMPGAVDPELYTRWVQFGAFSPILRTHTSSNPFAERRIWAYPEPYSDAMKEVFRERYALQPYIYTEARRTYDTGIAFMHPLYYDWPEAPEAYNSPGEYMFGDSMLVAPITAPQDAKTGLSSEAIWLPEGDWIEWSTGTHLRGPLKVEQHATIRDIPIYVRPGTIIPMQPPMLHTGAKPVDPLILTVFPADSATHTRYELYEDSGEAEKYQQEACSCAWTPIEAQQNGRELDVIVNAVRAGFPGMQQARQYQLRIPGSLPPEAVTVNGTALSYASKKDAPGWRFEGNTLTTVISVPSHAVNERVEVKIRFTVDYARTAALRSGFAGLMRRAQLADDTVAHAGFGLVVPDSLVKLVQTGDRLTYFPQSGAKELEALQANLQAAQQDVDAMIAEAQNGHPPTGTDPAQKPTWTEHTASLERARNLLSIQQ